MKPVLLIDLVGLTPSLYGEHTPNLNELREHGAFAPMTSVLPAVTCSAQASLLTGLMPAQHGAVGNGWFDRETAEIAFWRQSNRLVGGEKLYEAAKKADPSCTVAKIFWWWNMGASVDWSITPRPYYPADGRKIPAVYSWPTDFGKEIERDLGPFPFFDFWGPRSGLPSSRWIADATIHTLERHRPTLTMVYLPHLDYDFQRYGPTDARSVRAVADIDAIFGDLLSAARRLQVEVCVVSEYGIGAVDQPVDINRCLRRAGLLVARETPTGEVLDPFGSQAFAVADHQVAHVYTQSPQAQAQAKEALLALPGVEHVLDRHAQKDWSIDHPRSGDLVAIAEQRAWFTYYYWLDDAHEPDFARTIDIHRKPGYDPCEMFLDPKIAFPKARIASKLLKKKLGLRTLLDVIPIDPTLIRGSHGRLPDEAVHGPVFSCSRPFGECGPEPNDGRVEMASVKARILALLGG